MEEVCDLLGIPEGHGRQAELGRAFGVTPKAARKWLQGEGYPEMAKAVEICSRVDVNLTWLLQGVGPQRGHAIDGDQLRIVEALQALPREQRTAVFEFIRFTLDRTPGWFAEEQRGRYMAALDALRAREVAPPLTLAHSKVAPLPLGKKRPKRGT
jgi:transcriptional regulator with XRE-family HTH domain